ncbi:PTS system galactitol-specific transporter subunit IIB, partial [Lacticaseibacillus rhamnosus MTCC 5462]
MDFLHEHGLDANYTQTNVASLPEYDQKMRILLSQQRTFRMKPKFRLFELCHLL